MRVALHTGPDRLDFLAASERFTTYCYGPTAAPGFVDLLAAGGRAVTQPAAPTGLSLWAAHGNVNGVAFGVGAAGSHALGVPLGSIVSEEMMARRGSLSAGFQQTCAWIAPDQTRLLTETRTARISTGPSEGRILDLTLDFRAPDDTPVTLGQTEAALLRLRVAPALLPSGSGRIHNSRGDEGPDVLHGRAAAWCACIGVVEGETVGIVFFDHPDNPWHPPPWQVTEQGILSPSPFPWRIVEIAPGGRLVLRYRVQVHRGYVTTGWVKARMAEFAQP